jgi:hypothetical protein
MAVRIPVTISHLGGVGGRGGHDLCGGTGECPLFGAHSQAHCFSSTPAPLQQRHCESLRPAAETNGNNANKAAARLLSAPQAGRRDARTDAADDEQVGPRRPGQVSGGRLPAAARQIGCRAQIDMQATRLRNIMMLIVIRWRRGRLRTKRALTGAPVHSSRADCPRAAFARAGSP